MRRRRRREEDDLQKVLDAIDQEEPEQPSHPSEPPITRAEKRQIEDALKDFGLDDEGVNQYEGVLYDAMQARASDSYESGKTMMDEEPLLHVKTADFGHVPAYTLAEMEGYSKQLGFLVVEREKVALAQTIELAIANGDGAKQLAQDIGILFREGYHTLDKEGNVVKKFATASWSETVARTELSRASNAGTMAIYRKAGVKKIRWAAVDQESTCEPCHNADNEVVNLGDNFPFVDVPIPPAHPRCCCGVLPTSEFFDIPEGTPEEIARAKRGGRTAEEYEKKFGKKHAIDRR